MLQLATVQSVNPLTVRLWGAETDSLVWRSASGIHLQVGRDVLVTTINFGLIVVSDAGAGDTGWRPHGGTVEAGVNPIGLEWRIKAGIVWWRGQVWRSGGWTGNPGDPQRIITNLPALIRPATGQWLVGGGDLSWTQVGVSPDGIMHIYTGNSGTWPTIGGGYPLG